MQLKKVVSNYFAYHGACVYFPRKVIYQFQTKMFECKILFEEQSLHYQMNEGNLIFPSFVTFA